MSGWTSVGAVTWPATCGADVGVAACVTGACASGGEVVANECVGLSAGCARGVK